MNKNKAQQLLLEARKNLEFARYEMGRAEEDVVTYLVCHAVRKATGQMLNGFLMLNGESDSKEPMDRLLKKCRSYDRNFANIDLSVFDCKSLSLDESDCHCTDLKKVSDCLHVATKIEQLVTYTSMAY